MISANLYVKLDYNEEDKTKIEEAVKLLWDIAYKITKCSCSEGIMNINRNLICTAEELQSILDNNGIID